jgi:hypothetical protein
VKLYIEVRDVRRHRLAVDVEHLGDKPRKPADALPLVPVVE